MLVKIFFNTDGFIGAWSHHKFWAGKPKEITQSDIDFAKANGTPLFVEMNQNEISLFGKTCNCRNGIEVIPKGKTHEHEFGGLKVKMHSEQEVALVKETKKIHSLNKKSKMSDLELAIYQ